MRRKTKRKKPVAIVAGLLAVATVAAVLALVNNDAPANDVSPGVTVLAVVDGEQITVEDVVSVQLRMLYWDSVWLDMEDVLEGLIAEKLLLREAESEGYLPAMQEVEVELTARLDDRGVPLEFFHAALAESGLDYQGFLEHLQGQLAITHFLDDVIEVPEVTEEEAREVYKHYRESYIEMHPGEEPPPFEEMQERATAILQEYRRNEATYLLVMQLRAQADIVYM